MEGGEGKRSSLPLSSLSVLGEMREESEEEEEEERLSEEMAAREGRGEKADFSRSLNRWACNRGVREGREGEGREGCQKVLIGC